MGLLPHRFNFPFRHRPSSLPPPPPPPPEFLCSISGELMSDPVILPSGQTFERACIEACSLDLSSSSSSSSSSLLLIPNSALRSAIIRWCDTAGVPRPIPISPEAASRLARTFPPLSNPKPHTNCSTELPNENTSSSSSASSDQSSSSSSSSETTPVSADPLEENIISKLKTTKIIAYRFPPNQKSHSKCSTKLPNENESENTSSSSSDHSSSSSSSSETAIAADPLEENIISKLKTAKIEDLDKALISILESSRESASRRAALCTSRLLAALRGVLLSKHLSIRSTALAVIVNLSLEPQNKIKIVRSGAIPSIIAALQSPPSRPHAAGALFSLALEEQNRTPIGVLGAVPPLIRLFCNPKEDSRTRIESGMALVHLSFAELNMVKIVRISGVVKCLISVAKEEDEIELRRIAMRLMVGIVGNKEGKSVMLDGGAVEAIVLFLSKEEDDEEEEKEMAVVMLYGMSMAGLRFRAIARRVGAENLLERVAESFEGEKKEMVMVILRVLRGDEREKERDMARVLWAAAEEEEDGVVEEKMVVARRRLNRDSGGGSG